MMPASMRDLAVLLLGISFLVLGNAQSKPTAFLIFGDSLSDAGNYFHTNGLGNFTYPVANLTVNGTRIPAYWKGRYTNAQGIWSDRLTRAVKRIAVSNFAFAGAMLCPPSTYPNSKPIQLKIPSVINQTALFFQKLQNDSQYNATISKRDIVPVIWAGGNDIRTALSTLSVTTAPAFVQGLLQCLVASARVFLDRGVKAIVIANQAPVDLTPAAVASNAGPQFGILMGAINTQIAAAVSGLRTAYPNTNIVLWDVYADMSAAVKNYTALGFKYGNNVSCAVYDPAVSGLSGAPKSVCSKPNEYVFFDDLHPSFRGHGIITQSFIQTMLAAQVGINNTDLVKPQGAGRRALMASDLD